MNYTPNYALNQWEKADRIQMEDFNADNAKIDAALAALSNSNYYFGSWTGDGSINRAIELPFAPSFILVLGTYYEGGEIALITLATQESQRYISSYGAAIGTADWGGVLNGNVFQMGGYPAYNNYSGQKIYYLAIK